MLDIVEKAKNNNIEYYAIIVVVIVIDSIYNEARV